MTTKISKILTVFVTIASVAFMAVIIANAGGPNWRLKSQELKDVAFDQANPTGPWTSKRRTDGTDLGGGGILPAAIVSAQKKLIQEEQTVQGTLDQQINMRTAAIAEAKALITVDLDAMNRRYAELEKQFGEAQMQLNEISQNYTSEAKKQIADLDVLKLRAEEYIRDKNQLEELRAQREAATEELSRLKALLYQARANLKRAQQRRQLLVEDGADVGKYEQTDAADKAAAGQAAAGQDAAVKNAPQKDVPENDATEPEAPEKKE